MRHLTVHELSACADGALRGESLDLVQQHLQACQQCNAAMIELTEQDRALATLLEHDPTDAFLEFFVADLEELIRADAAGEKPAPPRQGRVVTPPPHLGSAGLEPKPARTDSDRRQR